jgi:ParB family chromosome partitioning protein
MIHELKILPEYFQEILDGKKTFEYRYNDRGYKNGDILHLREYDVNSSYYTNRNVYVEVTSILFGPNMCVSDGYVIMSIKRMYHEDWLSLFGEGNYE